MDIPIRVVHVPRFLTLVRSCMVVFGLPVFRVERRQIEVRHNFRFLVSQKDQKLHLDSS